MHVRICWTIACRRARVFLVPPALTVRNLVASGVPERVAMTVTGHKTRSVFDRYHIVKSQDLHQASAKLAARS